MQKKTPTPAPQPPFVTEQTQKILWICAAILGALFIMFIVVACSTLPGTTTPVATADLSKITAIADSSSCAKVNFFKRGLAPKPFLEGMALTFAKATCSPKRSDNMVVTKALGTDQSDALTHYGIKDTSLASVYTLMVGSGMAESSGEWCIGRDQSASNTSSDTCEAGLFQTSYNSRVASPELPKLFDKYSESKAGCFSKQFQGAIKCSSANMQNYGSGAGQVFQELSKSCPAFATEYHAVMLRTMRRHYGPINTKAAQYKSECRQMFDSVQALVDKEPALCEALVQ